MNAITQTTLAVFDARRRGINRYLLSHEMTGGRVVSRRTAYERYSRAIAYLTYRLYRRAQ